MGNRKTICTPFVKPDVGLHYKKTENHWLRIDKKLNDDKTSLIARTIPKRKDTDKKVNAYSYLYNYNQVSKSDNFILLVFPVGMKKWK